MVEVSATVLDVYTPPVILDPGEHELLSLAQTLMAPLVLLDDEVARTEARRLPFQVRGTFGILGIPSVVRSNHRQKGIP